VTRAPLVLAILVAGAAVFGSVTIAVRGPAVLEPRVAGRPIQVPEAGYVSSDTCRACHPSQYATWHR
jgi:multidrug efflux pump subunit AcrA (membrane-fusion protein)